MTASVMRPSDFRRDNHRIDVLGKHTCLLMIRVSERQVLALLADENGNGPEE